MATVRRNAGHYLTGVKLGHEDVWRYSELTTALSEVHKHRAGNNALVSVTPDGILGGSGAPLWRQPVIKIEPWCRVCSPIAEPLYFNSDTLPLYRLCQARRAGSSVS
ncbi:hypothetical protein AAFF_G00041870 [Aldrovandia affinis]|uniref:Uncharacterized protein n=1 Tax=Aldrovandia affinis TaxID=143900 RepID=A0AAD7S2N0_9TELE|nr:hypothetical protein AAFF_G00041870 [Aldrovandia affinis]